MINPMEMSGRRVLVTGASSGIGRETAMLLSRLGAKLIVTGRREKELKETLEGLDGEDHHVYPLDLASAEDIPRWIKEISVLHGPLYGLVHCAGISITQPIRAVTRKSYEQTMTTNLFSAIELIKGFRQKGVCASSGSIVLVSSASAYITTAGLSIYTASKGALIAMVKPLAAELAPQNVTINCVAPAFVKTSMFEDMSKIMTEDQIKIIERKHILGVGVPLDVAYSIVFLLADTGRWITGTALVVDGGFTAVK